MGKIKGNVNLELKLAELHKKLDEKNERINYLEEFLEMLPGIIYCKQQGKFVYGNSNLVKKYKLKSSEDLIGKTDYDLVSRKLADAEVLNDKIIIETGEGKTFEEKGLSINGKPAVYLTSKVPLWDKDNKAIGIVSVSIEITDHKKDEELYIKHEVAEKVTAVTNKIAGSMVHELRTPLAIINTQADLLSLALSSDKPQSEKDDIYRRSIKAIKDTIKSAVHIIDDMLVKIKSFSRGGINNASNLVAIANDVEEFLAGYPFKGDERKIIKLKNFDTPANRFSYLGTSMVTKNVLYNLLKNSLYAIKEAEKGAITIELRAGDVNDKFNYLIFRDTALGIEQKFVDTIFDRFATKKAVTNSSAGLGLSFCKMVMKTYGGDITCKSELGKYTEFILSFPKVDTSASD